MDCMFFNELVHSTGPPWKKCEIFDKLYSGEMLGTKGAGMIAPLLAILLQYFELAQTMKPPRRESINYPVLETEPG